MSPFIDSTIPPYLNFYHFIILIRFLKIIHQDTAQLYYLILIYLNTSYHIWYKFTLEQPTVTGVLCFSGVIKWSIMFNVMQILYYITLNIMRERERVNFIVEKIY